MFAKLFNETSYGQILVKIDQNDEGYPEIRTYFEPKGLGVCSLALSYEDSDEGWDQAELVFEKFEVEQAEKIVESALNSIKQ
jgi:hypothetical protein